MENSVCEELEYIFGQFPKCYLKILLRNFNTKVGRQGTFKVTIGNEILYEISNIKGDRVLNLPHQKI